MRLSLFVMFAFSLIGPLFAGQAQAEELQWHRSTTLTEPSKYGENYPHYDYVNPQAPKGGTFNRLVAGSYDTFNPYIVGGVPAGGLVPFGGGILYDTLMDQSLDEGGVSHGALAEATQYPQDYSWVKFRLRKEAMWHDGKPITPQDVIWSYNVLKANSPYYNRYYADVEKAEITGPHEVTFMFKRGGNHELPHIMGDLVVLPQHWWEGTDKTGKKRDITQPTLEIPLGSGPYRIESFDPGRGIIWKRVENYWGRNLPINIGRYNFDHIRYNYLLDANAEWEAFKKGGLSDVRQEPAMQYWMERYTFPAVKKGYVKQLSFPQYGTGRMQGFFLNERREKFADIRVRKALTLALDFEQMNRKFFYNKYKRTKSYFSGSDLAATGLPTGRELEMLETVRNEIPEEVFTKEFDLPHYKVASDTRKYLSEAMELLKQAGWRLNNNQLVNAKSEPFTIEFLLNSPTFERHVALYAVNLRRLGIGVSIRIVDGAQYQARRNDFDYDVIIEAIGQSSSPGNEQADYFGSQAANEQGTRNYAGIKNPAVDKLISYIVYAKDREELVAATKAMDRVLLWNYYVVPQWYYDQINIAYWNKFGIPEKQPLYVGFDMFSMWIDREKEAALSAR